MARPRLPLSRRRLLALIAAELVLAAVVVAYLILREDNRSTWEVVERDDPVEDLLGWLPADAQTRRSFAVWTGEGADATPAAAPDARGQQELGLTPFPTTIGLGAGWRERFGYDAGDVDQWAVTGPEGSETAILAGDFDERAIRAALRASEYAARTYRGAELFVRYETATPGPTVVANAIALLAGRVITAADPAAAMRAIDAATGQTPSLADDDTVKTLLEALGPSAGLMALDATDQAAACGYGATTPPDRGRAPSGRYVAVSYGHAEADGARQTLVVVGFADERAAVAAGADYESAWLEGRVTAGTDSAAIAAFGRVTGAEPHGAFLITTLIDGKANSWTPAAIRFADPVCQVVADAAPVAPPATPTPRPTGIAGFRPALDALPDPGPDGVFLVADLAGIAEAHAAMPPLALTGTPAPADVGAWLDALGPLPGFIIFPLDSTRLARWPTTFGIPLGAIEVVAETRPADPLQTVGLLIGRWDPNQVAQALQALGYDAVERGTALHFALTPSLIDDPSHPAHLAAGAAWNNVALLGDRLFVSPSIEALWAVVDPLAGIAPAREPPTTLPPRERLLAAAPETTAAVVVGAGAARRSCIAQGTTAQDPTWDAFAALWTAHPAGDTASLAILPTSDTTFQTAASALDAQIQRAAIASEPLTTRLTYTGIDRHDLPDAPPLVVARFTLPPATAAPTAFFAATTEACQFVP